MVKGEKPERAETEKEEKPERFKTKKLERVETEKLERVETVSEDKFRTPVWEQEKPGFTGEISPYEAAAYGNIL